MSLEDLAAGVVLLGIIAYAMFGGADFGGGIWTGLAGGSRAAQQRQAISRAMGPVWETNHVWLILIVVALFTAFPPAFADLFTALLVPLVIALVAIVFRGAAFAFRHFGYGAEAVLPGMAALFSVASVVAPLTMGMALGAIASGHIAIRDGAVTLQPFSILCGLMAVAMCGFLAAHYMTVRTTGEMQEDFRKRGLLAGLLLGLLAIIALPVAYWDAEPFWDELAKPSALAVMSAAAVLWLASLLVVWRRWYVLAPPVVAPDGSVIVVADHSKWGVVSNFEIASLDQVHTLVVDTGLSPESRAELKARSVNVVLAGPEAGDNGHETSEP